MSKRITARAIIIENDFIYLIFRRKISGNIKKEYYVIPGGGVEFNETLEEALVRELKEELGIDIKILGYLGKQEDEYTCHNFFHCQVLAGELKLGGPELEKCNTDNYYEIKHIKINKLNKLDIQAPNMIIKALNKEYLND